MNLEKEIKSLLKSRFLTLNKGLGQNFLTEESILDDIADSAHLQGDELVVEIGSGLGTLTRKLAKKAKKVIAVEIDQNLVSFLQDNLPEEYDNIEIVHADFLKVDLEDLLSEALENNWPIKVVANLPYYITTPIILKLLESDIPIEHLSLLVQKEVAERMASEPGSKVYGALSVICQYYADTNVLFTISPDNFMPSPKVDSALVELVPIEPSLEPEEKEKYFKVVKAAFANRRKTLLNSLSQNLNLDKKELETLLEDIDIDPRVRAEKLSEADFKRITSALGENLMIPE